MKKFSFMLAIMLMFGTFGIAFAQDFNFIKDLTPDQKEKIAIIQGDYNKEYNLNETRIMDYTNKLNQIKNDTTKAPDQISLLSAAYERNLNSIKARQEQLKKETDELYKSVLTDEQFKLYQAQQLRVENAFSDFLRK